MPNNENKIEQKKNLREVTIKAYENMHLDTIEYLLKALKDGCKSELQYSLSHSVHPSEQIVVDLLVNAISAKQYGLASQLVQKFPNFASKSDDVLMALAKTFPSGLNDAETLLYPSLEIIVEKIHSTAFLSLFFFIHVPHMLYDYFFNGNKKFDIDILSLLVSLVLCPVPSILASAVTLIYLLILMGCFPFLVLYFLWWNCAKILVGPINQIDNKKREWGKAKKVLELVQHYSFKGSFNGERK
ncbi:hypothetical protein L1987_64842 [Smallanthus sonchifolius]|uniref:Uncharacterized protein n=1 Tax=Smallanthus sonchifolius TaxID=185202 RepID=A0ACB9BSR9_9ASTR|nr:hypothetical protein L1987_64842 [Smallanthus sonchifolius]